MAEEITYNGKPLSSFNLWELGHIEAHIKDTLSKREEARKHNKFNSMKLPDPNPEFLKLKTAIEAEIRKKQNA